MVNPYGPNRLKASTRVMLGAVAWYPISWAVIHRLMLSAVDPYHSDFIGTILYFSGPLPVIPTMIFLVGCCMRYSARTKNSPSAQ
jgi:hypothetical protein